MQKHEIVGVPTQSTSNYGVLTDISKGLNYTLGDRTGRTVSMRTAQGFKTAFKLDNMSDDDAEDIVHLGMVATAGLLTSKNNGAKAGGLLVLLGLVACYQNGK
jgi:hypothetical protein